MKSLWKKIQIICSIACIIVYVISTVYAFLFICGAVREQQEITRHEYSELKDFAVSAGVLGWTQASFKDDILEAVAVSKTLQAVIISGTEDYFIAVEKTPGIIKLTGNYPHFNSRFYFLKRLENTPLRFDDQHNVTLSAVAAYIDFNELLYILRRALLAILSAAIVSFTLLIVDVFRTKTAETKLDGAGDKPPLAETAAEENTDDTIPADKSLFQEAAPENALPRESEGAIEKMEEDTPGVHGDIFGLFDGEPALTDELAPELEKAEEAEKDLSLIAAFWTKEGVPCQILAETAAKEFKAGSLIIERHAPITYIIAVDTTLEEAFAQAKRLHHNACAALPAEQKSELLIGISARAGRSLHALRLISETERALGKAGEDRKTPIVAFKADPEKYKIFLAKKNQ